MPGHDPFAHRGGGLEGSIPELEGFIRLPTDSGPTANPRNLMGTIPARDCEVFQRLNSVREGTGTKRRVGRMQRALRRTGGPWRVVVPNCLMRGDDRSSDGQQLKPIFRSVRRRGWTSTGGTNESGPWDVSGTAVQPREAGHSQESLHSHSRRPGHWARRRVPDRGGT